MTVLSIEPNEAEAYRSLTSDFPARLPEFQVGTTFPLGVALLKRVNIPLNDQIFAADDVSTWTIRAVLDTEVAGNLTTNSAAPTATVTLVQQGDSTHNHKVSVALPPLRYGGVWTFVVAGVESGPIGYGDNEAEVKAIVGAVSGVGAANVAVDQTDEDTFLIEFVGTKALTAITGIDAHGSTLEVLAVKSGTLDFRTEGVSALVPEGDAQAVVSFTVLGTPSAGTEQLLLRRDVILLAVAGDYTASQPEGFTSLEPNGDGSSNISAASGEAVVSVIADAADSAYVYVIALTTDARPGAEADIYIQLPATANPTIEIRNATNTGTLLHSVSGDTDNAIYQNVRLRFNGTAWVKFAET